MTGHREALPPFLRRVREGSSQTEVPREEDGRGQDTATESDPVTGGASTRDGLRRALTEVGEQLDEIIAEADRAAAAIRQEAHDEADRYFAERRRRADEYDAEARRRIEGALAALRTGLAAIAAEGERVVAGVEAAIADTERVAAERRFEPASPDRGVEGAEPPPAPAGTVAYPGRATDRAPTRTRA